jgi:hypothetical protein
MRRSHQQTLWSALCARGVRLRTLTMVIASWSSDDVRQKSHVFCGAACMALRQRLGSQCRHSANILALMRLRHVARRHSIREEVECLAGTVTYFGGHLYAGLVHWRTLGGGVRQKWRALPLTVRLRYAKKWRTHLRVRQTALSNNVHAG